MENAATLRMPHRAVVAAPSGASVHQESSGYGPDGKPEPCDNDGEGDVMSSDHRKGVNSLDEGDGAVARGDELTLVVAMHGIGQARAP